MLPDAHSSPCPQASETLGLAYLKIPRSLMARRHWLLVPRMLLEVSSPLQASVSCPGFLPTVPQGCSALTPPPGLYNLFSFSFTPTIPTSPPYHSYLH